MDDLPVQAGSYTLLLALSTPWIVDVGVLGRFKLCPGVYAYQGSAYGPGGLRARLGRHLRGSGRARWHIDYLRAEAEVLGYVYLIAEARLPPKHPFECEWSQGLAGLRGASIPIPGFGASDCKSGCRAHLVYIPASNPLAQFSQILDGSKTRVVTKINPPGCAREVEVR